MKFKFPLVGYGHSTRHQITRQGLWYNFHIDLGSGPADFARVNLCSGPISMHSKSMGKANTHKGKAGPLTVRLQKILGLGRNQMLLFNSSNQFLHLWKLIQGWQLETELQSEIKCKYGMSDKSWQSTGGRKRKRKHYADEMQCHCQVWWFIVAP